MLQRTGREKRGHEAIDQEARVRLLIFVESGDDKTRRELTADQVCQE